MIEVGAQIGPYTIESSLGAGGFGSVWKARNGSGRVAAVKVLHKELVEHRLSGKGPTVADRFLAEARLLQKLEHRGLVQIFDVIEDRKNYIVAYAMEHLVGQDLAEFGDTIDLPTLLEATAKTADTLAFLHDNGIVHRDVKAANIFITDPPPGGRHHVKLLDFGVAKELHGEAMLAQTATGMFLGSVSSMPPESFRRWSSDDTMGGHMDQWSLGVTLYQCLTGRMPFNDPSMVGLIHKIETADPEPLKLQARFGLDDTPEMLSAAVLRCLEKKIEDRHESMTKLSNAIRRVSEVVCANERTLFELLDEPANTVLDGEAASEIAEIKYALTPQDDLQDTAADLSVPETLLSDSSDLGIADELNVNVRRTAFERDATRLEPAPETLRPDDELPTAAPTLEPRYGANNITAETLGVDDPHDKAPLVVGLGTPVSEAVAEEADTPPSKVKGPPNAVSTVDELPRTRRSSPPRAAAPSTPPARPSAFPVWMIVVGFVITLLIGFALGWLVKPGAL